MLAETAPGHPGARPSALLFARNDEVEAAWRAAMWAKAAGHGINSPDFVQPTRPMSAIGG
jgi:molybdenum cofactor biosynthesis enzyme MoaA